MRITGMQDALRAAFDAGFDCQWDGHRQLAEQLSVPYLFVVLAETDQMEETAVQTRDIEEWLQWRAELATEGGK